MTNLLSTPQTIELLLKLRQTSSIDCDLNNLSPDDRAYFETELAVRKAKYNGLEARIPKGASPWVRNMCLCYRDLFVNPRKALQSLETLIPTCPNILDLPLRLHFWRAHSLLLTGNVAKGDLELARLLTLTPPDYFWKTEVLVITSLGHFFAGRSHQSLLAHYTCHTDFEIRPDLFFQTFNAAMATRVALKLCDAHSFEFFSQKLESLLVIENDTRFRLRHTAYRALILNQLGEHEAAERYWTIGDQMLTQTESYLERGHFSLYRGLSHALKGEIKLALEAYALSRTAFNLVGSPPHFVSELEIARQFTELANPAMRGMNLKRTFELTTTLEAEFKVEAQLHTDSIRMLYSDASQFCSEILNGTIPEKRSIEFTSVTLSIIDNVSRSEHFAKGLSHFRLIPNFIAAVKQTSITEKGVAEALQSVLKIRTLYDGKFTLAPEFSSLEKSPEYKTILEFASTLCELGKNADRLFTAESRLNETKRAAFLIHDLRYVSTDLAKLAQSNSQLVTVSKKLTDYIDGFLNSVRVGHAPDGVGIVSIDHLCEKLASTIEGRTGKSFTVSGDTQAYLWTSEAMLERILLNFIRNGIDSGTGECPVDVFFERAEKYFCIQIRDNGPGISVEVYESIADDSRDTAITTKQEGTGLGLRSAYECAKAIGAAIKLASSTENGTCFEITIPIEPTYSRPDLSGVEYLVIDDSEAVLESWNCFSKKHARQILSVLPKDAVSVLNSLPESIQWIVLDYDMKLPNGNGATLAKTLKKTGARLALSTGYKPKELPEDARGVEWDAVISKKPQNLEDCIAPIFVVGDLEKTNHNLQFVAIRHELKSKLTPLRSIYDFVKDEVGHENRKINHYISLMGRTIDSMEETLDRS